MSEEKGPRKKGLFGKLADLVSEETDSAPAVNPAASPPAAAAPAVPLPKMPQRTIAGGTVDPFFFGEVGKALDERVSSEALTQFLGQYDVLEGESLDEGTRFRLSLKTTVAILKQPREEVISEIERSVSARITALVQERASGESEISQSAKTDLGATSNRLDEIKRLVADLREQIGRLQEEQGKLEAQQTVVEARTQDALAKFRGACDKHAAVLQEITGKISLYLRPSPTTKKEA